MHMMRTTIDIPEDLILEAMRVTQMKTKTDVIKEGLITLIRKEKLKKLKKYKGKLNLEMDINILRKR